MATDNQTFHVDTLIRLSLIAAITYWTFLLLSPLFDIFSWGFILAVAIYPIFKWLSRHLGNRPKLAATIISLLSLLLIVGSLALLANNMVDTLKNITGKVDTGEQMIPPPSLTVQQWPIIGERVYDVWSAAYSNFGQELKKNEPYLIKAGSFMLEKMADKSFELIVFIISVLLSGYLMIQSDTFMVGVRKFAERIAPERGFDLIKIMRETIQNVSRGVIGVSLLQTVLFGLLLLIAGIPAAGMLSFIAMILCIVQIGLYIVVIPLVAWLLLTKSFVFAIVMSICLFLVALLDTVLKPIVLSRGLTTPMILILVGVIGGVMTHGLIGIFIGPVVLAIFYDVLRHWLYYGAASG